MAHVAVVGLATMDTVLAVPEFPLENRKYLCKMTSVSCGGCAANVAINLGLLDARVSLVTWVGRDAQGEEVLAAVKRYGVSVPSCITLPGVTPQVFIFLNRRSGSRTAFLTERDRPMALTREQEEAVAEASLIYYDGSWPEIAEQVLSLARGSGVPVFFNFDVPTEHAKVFAGIAEFVVASADAVFTLGMPEADRIPDAVRALRNGHGFSCVTCGADGAFLFDGEDDYYAAALPIGVADTTGAGDAFQAGLLRAITEGLPVGDCLRHATALAAIKCEHGGSNLAGMEACAVREALRRFVNRCCVKIGKR